MRARNSALLRAATLAVAVTLAPAAALAAGREPGDAAYLDAANRTPPFDMPAIVPPTFPDREFDILDFGAVADGTTLNTDAIAAAIAACSEAGGGRVVVPPGVWLTGPIHLASNINLHIAEGAVVRFIDEPEHYLPPVFVRWAGFEVFNYSPLIYVHEAENVAITGRGILDGQGSRWWTLARRDVTETTARLYQQVLDGVPPEERVYGTLEWPLRPPLIQPIAVRNLLIEDITVVSSPFWLIHLTYVENAIVRRVTVRATGPNSDGINVDSSRNVIVEDCRVSTYDDGVAIKAGMNEDGWRVNRPSENIIVRRCVFEKGQGGVSIGSAMSAGVRNVYIHDNIFRGLWMALWIKSTRGRGGFIENVWHEHNLVNRISHHAVGINTGYSAFMATTAGKPPVIRNIHYRDITMTYVNQRLLEFIGLPDVPLENISFTNSTVTGTGVVRLADVDGFVFDNTTWQSISQDPAAAIFTDVRNVTVRNAVIPPSAPTYLRVSGERTEGVLLEGLIAPDEMTLVSIEDGADPEEVSVR